VHKSGLCGRDPMACRCAQCGRVRLHWRQGVVIDGHTRLLICAIQVARPSRCRPELLYRLGQKGSKLMSSKLKREPAREEIR
jgi:hypothetical protein